MATRTQRRCVDAMIRLSSFLLPPPLLPGWGVLSKNIPAGVPLDMTNYLFQLLELEMVSDENNPHLKRPLG